jgi:hypothetical protein
MNSAPFFPLPFHPFFSWLSAFCHEMMQQEDLTRCSADAGTMLLVFWDSRTVRQINLFIVYLICAILFQQQWAVALQSRTGQKHCLVGKVASNISFSHQIPFTKRLLQRNPHKTKPSPSPALLSQACKLLMILVACHVINTFHVKIFYFVYMKQICSSNGKAWD